jgi:DNA-binding CsgD family transcriptional regulator
LVLLIGELGDRALVVETVGNDGRPGGFDVAIFDLDAADQVSISDELRHVAEAGVPVVGLIYSPGNAAAPDLGLLPIITLASGPAHLWSVLRSLNVAGSDSPRRSQNGSLPNGLTQRELDVLRLIARGASNQEVAAQLYLSVNSVKTYIRTGYRKAGITNRASAVLWGIQHGLTSGPRPVPTAIALAGGAQQPKSKRGPSRSRA